MLSSAYLLFRWQSWSFTIGNVFSASTGSVDAYCETVDAHWVDACLALRRLMHIACELDRIATCFFALALFGARGRHQARFQKKPSIGSFGPTT